ncbi:MAG: hypothetical protein EHM16_10215 [Betaproteobacteria bacterium]|nr:MAG: hypothetical protein EHM16_10215 [Betaproteobacteria bacterium]
MSMVNGRTFNEQAHHLLTITKYGFVEHEMIPDSDGIYSNGGTLDTRGWKGKKYRRYYLGPADSPHCVPVGEMGASASVIIAGAPEPEAPKAPYCLAVEIVPAPISTLSVRVAERFGFIWWGMKVVSIPIPIPLPVRWDDIVVTDDRNGHELGRYSGFHDPDPVTKKASCLDYRKAGDLLTNVLAPSSNHAFLKSQPWYEASGVQRFL